MKAGLTSYVFPYLTITFCKIKPPAMTSLKSILTVGAVALASHFSLAQSTISFGGIYSTPVGSFGMNDPDEGGYSKPGIGFQFEAQLQSSAFVEELKLGLYLSFQHNDIDRAAFQSDLSTELGQGLRAEIDGGGFRPVRAMLGPTYQFKLGESFSLSLKGAIGLLMANSDPMHLNVIDESNGDVLLKDVVYFRGNTTFSYLVGLDFGYEFSKYWAVGIFADYSSATEELDAAFDTSTYVRTEQTISFINSGIFLRMNMN